MLGFVVLITLAYLIDTGTDEHLVGALLFIAMCIVGAGIPAVLMLVGGVLGMRRTSQLTSLADLVRGQPELPVTHIANQLGTSETATLRIVRAALKRGVIRGHLDPRRRVLVVRAA